MKIVCFGDSLTSCGGETGRYSDILQDRFPDHTVINKGVGGEGFEDARERFRADVLDLKPDIVLIEFGANDWWRDERPSSAWASDLEDLVVEMRKAAVDVVILGVFGHYRNSAGELVEKTYGTDERAIAYREQEQAIAEKHGCSYIPNIQIDIVEDRCAWRDRNHPNENGNRRVADAIEPVLERLLGKGAAPVRKPTLTTTRDMWNEAVALAPDRFAVVDGDRRLTYAQAGELVTQLAAGLYGIVGKGSPRVAVFLPNCLEYFIVYWAIQRLGGVIVPLNTWLKQDSLAAVFKNVNPDILIVRDGREARMFADIAGDTSTRVIAVQPGKSTDLPSLDSLYLPDTAVPEIPLCGEDMSIIMHTSGTTSVPKGAIMRHSDLMFNVMTTINAHQFCSSDVHILVNPMFHCTALYSSLPTAAYQKTPVIITSDTKPESLMELIQTERISTFLTVPSILQRIVALADIGEYDASSLRLIGYAGSPMPVSTIRHLQDHFPEVELHNFFGLTETTSMTHVLSGEDAMDRPDSIGKLLPFVSALIVDEEENVVPAGTVGELIFDRSNIISGYLNQPDKLQAAMTTIDGREWFKTGDLACVDEEGYFFIKGRKKDMIIVGGENVFAAEVEGVLFGHPNVREAAIKGIPATGIRASLGEMIKAYIVPDQPGLTEMDVRKYCHARLPSYKLPHLIEFRDALPRNPAGKVVKDELD